MNARFYFASAQVFRLEYVFATIPGLTITFFLCARHPADILTIPVIEGLVVAALMIFAGLGINAVTDREIDAKYATHKSRIPDAVDVIGVRRVWWIIVSMILTAFGLAAHLCWQFQSWLPLLLALGEAFFGYGYSLSPLHFKIRGVALHALSLTLATGIIPFALSAYTYLGEIPPALAIFIAGFAIVQYGFEFANQALDYLEDRTENLLTPAVRLGLHRSIDAALFVPTVGMVVAFAGLYLLFVSRIESSGLEIPVTQVLTAWGVAIFVMLVGYAHPLTKTFEMRALCRGVPAELCAPKLPGLIRYARWQASSVAGTAAAAAIFYVTTNYLWAPAIS